VAEPEQGAPLLDAEVVGLLLPQRAPMRMVDAIDGYALSPRRSLRAHKHLLADDPVFQGHFPAQAVWPGVLVIEGLAQSCLLLGVLALLEEEAAAAGQDRASLLEALRAAAGHPGSSASAVPDPGQAWRSLSVSGPALRPALAAADVRFLAPTGPGQRLAYRVELAALQPSATLARFEVSAERAGRPVARGDLTLSLRSP